MRVDPAGWWRHSQKIEKNHQLHSSSFNKQKEQKSPINNCLWPLKALLFQWQKSTFPFYSTCPGPCLKKSSQLLLTCYRSSTNTQITLSVSTCEWRVTFNHKHVEGINCVQQQNLHHLWWKKCVWQKDDHFSDRTALNFLVSSIFISNSRTFWVDAWRDFVLFWRRLWAASLLIFINY